MQDRARGLIVSEQQVYSDERSESCSIGVWKEANYPLEVLTRQRQFARTDVEFTELKVAGIAI